MCLNYGLQLLLSFRAALLDLTGNLKGVGMLDCGRICHATAM